jgi:hypothetical protein
MQIIKINIKLFNKIIKNEMLLKKNSWTLFNKINYL